MIAQNDLTDISGRDLDKLFADAPPGDVPSGKGRGQALMATGTMAGPALTALVRILAWHGKDFDDPTHTLRNLITPLSIRAISADVYIDASWFDGRPCIVLDYSKTSRVAGFVRDEIRQIAPRLYLGLVYVGSRRAPIRFSLEFAEQ